MAGGEACSLRKDGAASGAERRADDRQRLSTQDFVDARESEQGTQPAGRSRIGPGLVAALGAGSGKAVGMAVWKAEFPSTFCITWWMWPSDFGVNPALQRPPPHRYCKTAPIRS
jgi:hypothetical protein